MEPSYRKEKVHEKKMCKHCKSTAHTSIQHGKHYKDFKAENKEKRMEKHMKLLKNDNDADDTHRKSLGLQPGKVVPKGAESPEPKEREDGHAKKSVHKKSPKG